MTRIGKTDAFERKYTQEFRNLAAPFGEFVLYERDRAARDIGLHLTHPKQGGGERVSASLCWFQLKGIMESTLPLDTYESMTYVKISLNVGHLKFWYMQLMPTYLAIYMECSREFLVLDIQAYVEREWGNKIFDFDQKSATVTVSRSSVLDKQAFSLILRKNERDQWAKVLKMSPDDLRHCQRDYNLISSIGTASDRGVCHRMTIRDWQSKTRGEVYVTEHPRSGKGDPRNLRTHWEYMMTAERVEEAYPYLALSAVGSDHDLWSDDDDEPHLELRSGERVAGIDVYGEYHQFTLAISLNDLGVDLFQFVQTLEKLGLVSIRGDGTEIVSIAPWEHRAV